jgi:DNA ligase-1
MRTGVHDGLIQEALARAAGVAPELVRRAGLFLSDPAEVARLALTGREAGLRAVQVRLFVPLLPMLAEPAADLGQVLAAHGGRTGLEVKYDGARIQIHRRGDRVRIWTRRLTEVTASLPEVVELAQRDVAADEAILEGEVVAVAPDGRPLPFQELMRRLRRVHELDAVARQVPIRLYLFDCLQVGGASLVDRPYAERWATLAETTGGRHLAERRVTAEPGDAEMFLHEALAAGHEGVIAKALDSAYAPGVRGSRWFKVKLAHHLDCVIVAADRGSGRRRGWLSNYHLAVRDEAGGFADVGKTFKGLTDREFAEMTARLTALALADDGYTVRVRPEVVVEVAYNEIQPSPRYRSGFALRFARIARIRDDKGPADADTLATLRARHARQSETKGQGHAPSELVRERRNTPGRPGPSREAAASDARLP